MPTPCARHLFEYAVVRVRPRIEREEFVNVGLVMMCKRRRWVMARIMLKPERLQALWPDIDLDEVADQLRSFESIARGDRSPIGQLEAHERFRWLSAVRSASITTSRPHPGFTDNLEATFERLFAELVD